MTSSRLPALRPVAVAALAAAVFVSAGLVPVDASAQAVGKTAGKDRSKVTEFTLKNGLDVVVIPDHRAPVVTHMIWYKVGSADETPGKSGLAHFLEHLMFKGTSKNPTGRFSQVVAEIGGQENAFTSSDYTGYYQRVPAEKLKTVMEFEADRMTGLVLSDDVVLPERDVILEERNQRIDNNPAARLGEQIDAALFLNHPYGRPVIGWRREMEKLSREDAIAFYKRFYAPNNAVLVVAGDVTPAAVKTLAEATYGKIAPMPKLAARVRPQEPPPIAVRSLTVSDPRVEQPSVRRSYLVPSSNTAKPGESEALEVLAHILGTGSNSRLYDALVVKKRVAVSAGAWYSGNALDMGKFGVYGVPQPSETLPQLEAEIDAVIAEVAGNGVTPEELSRAKTRLVADAVYAQDSQAAMARWYGASLTTGSTVADVLAWPDRIKAVTADQVKEAARQWLQKERSVTGYLVKTAAAKPEKRS